MTTYLKHNSPFFSDYRPLFSIRMTQIFFWIHYVSYKLLQLLYLRKSTRYFSVEDGLLINMD